MVYRAIGLMSGSSLDGLDIVFAEFREQAGQWEYEILQADCYPYSTEWTAKLQSAHTISARDYQLLHTAYGHYIGEQVNRFIEKYQLHFKVALVASHGHTTFHLPAQKMTAQLGDGAAIAGVTGLPVITDLRALDIALGGQGAPIVPIGEQRLLRDYHFFLNIGGIANISLNGSPYIAFDVCPANRVLNMLAKQEGQDFDEGGKMASAGKVDQSLLDKLNEQDYYQQAAPKSLANDFGTDIIYPLITAAGIPVNDALRTYAEHIVFQISGSIAQLRQHHEINDEQKLLVTGGGALNSFLISHLRDELQRSNVEVVVPEPELINFKEALIMAFIGVLRWRQEYNVLSSVTGAARDSIGGAVWIGDQ